MKDAGQYIETRYLSDPIFHRVVDTIVYAAVEKDWTQLDLIQVMRAIEVRLQEEQLRKLTRVEALLNSGDEG